MKLYFKLIILFFSFIFSGNAYAEMEVFYELNGIKLVYGLKDSKGNIVFPAKYKSIQKETNNLGKIFYKLEDLRGYLSLVDAQGRIIIKNDDYQALRFMDKTDNLINVYSHDKEGVFDSNGKQILPIDFSTILLQYHKVNSREQIVGFHVKVNDKSGYYDLDGKCIVPPIYDYVDLTNLNEQYIKVRDGIYIGLYDLENRTEIIAPDRFTYLGNIEGDWYFGEIDTNTVALINLNKEVFVGPGLSIQLNDEKSFKVKYRSKEHLMKNAGDNNYYIIDCSGHIIEQKIYEPVIIPFRTKNGSSLEYFSDENMKWGVREEGGGETIIPCLYDNIDYMSEYDNFKLYNGKFQGITDLQGNIIIDANKYHKIDYSDITKRFNVRINSTVGLLDSIGNEIIPAGIYSKIDYYAKFPDFYLVGINGSKGIRTSRNEEVLPCYFNNIKLVTHLPCIGPHFEVSLNGKIGLFNKEGICIVPPIFTSLQIKDPKFYFNIKKFPHIETHNYQYKGIYSLEGKEIVPANQAVELNYNEMMTDFPYFSITDSTGRTGIIDCAGNVLFPMQDLKILSIKKNENASTGYIIVASNELLGDHTVVYELFTNKVLVDNKEEQTFRNLIVEGDDFFTKGKYSEAIKAYDSAITIKELDYLVYNRGVAHYNKGDYRKALNDMLRFKELTNDFNDNEKADIIIKNAQLVLEGKESEDERISMGLLGFAFSIANINSMSKSSNGNPNSNISTSVQLDSSCNKNENKNISVKGEYPSKCVKCAGLGYFIKYSSNFDIDERPYCETCKKNVAGGHYHQICTNCEGKGGIKITNIEILKH